MQRDERVLVVWSDTLDAIIPTCNDFENRLIKLLWRTRPNIMTLSPSTSAIFSSGGHIAGMTASGLSSLAGSVSGHLDMQIPTRTNGDQDKAYKTSSQQGLVAYFHGKTLREKDIELGEIPSLEKEERPTQLYAPIYNGLAAGMALLFIGNGISE
jgi:hypothetical protein